MLGKFTPKQNLNIPPLKYDMVYKLKEDFKDLSESAIYKLRKHVEQVDDIGEEDEDIGDDFENLYKGEISKSGVPILPSKRARKIPEKIQVSKEDIAELKNEGEEIASEEQKDTETSNS